jgi:CheY-like chemotaxis protein
MAVAARLQQYRVRDLLAERAEAIARRDHFLAMLGHELRNPLGAVSTCAEVLVQGPDVSHAEECARIIGAQARDMKRLLDDLLDVSRLTRGRLALRREPLELGRILREVVNQVGHELAGRRQPLDLSLPQDPLPVHADPTRLRQVFANLLNNASRYSPPGSAVILSAEREGAGVLVRVQDRGQGMTRETLEHVFEPFWQAPDRDGHGGLGIGLTLAHRLVEMHGGRMEARSDGPGLGSELLVYLPLSEQQPTAGPSVARPAEANGRRVLVIDDNHDLAFGIRLLLGRQGYQVELAGDGAAGIAAAERVRPDVILLDIGLPDMDGFEVARCLRRLPALDGVRVIGMSGFGGDDQCRRSEAAGIDRYLTKPVTADVLAEAVAAGS